MTTEIDLDEIDVFNFQDTPYFGSLPEDRKKVAQEILDYVPVHDIAKNLDFNLSRFYTWRKEYPSYHHFLKRLVSMRSSQYDDGIIIFRGFPEDAGEVKRRASIVRYIFNL